MVKCLCVYMSVTFLLILPSPKVFTPDDPPRPSRPKASLGLVIIMMIMKIGHGFDYFSDADLRGIKESPHVCQYLGGGWGLCLSWEWFIWEWYFDLFVFARTPPFRFLSGIEICESSLNGEDLSMWIEGPISKATTVPPVKGFLNTYGWDR